MDKRGKIGLIILFLAILLILAVAIYFTFFFYYKCPQSDLACYLGHQEKCAKTKFINDQVGVTWSYKITGKSSGNCNVDVKILKIKEGSPKLVSLEEKDMICFVPIGSRKMPEEDLKKCHGLLKEEIQDIMIRDAHNYIISNMGQISEELKKPVI